jgi:hypothetical protein
METSNVPHREINKLDDQAIFGVANNPFMCCRPNLELWLKMRCVLLLFNTIFRPAKANLSTVISELVEL